MEWGEKNLTILLASSGPANFTKDFDENKENKTPEGSQGEVDWLQQYDMEREREEQELQQALAQSLQEQVRAHFPAPASLPRNPRASWPITQAAHGLPVMPVWMRVGSEKQVSLMNE